MYFLKYLLPDQDCAEEIRNSPRKSFSDLTSFFFFEILTKNSVWKSAFSTYVYITSRNWFFMKNNGKNEQLLLKTFISKSIFRDFLLVKMKIFRQKKLVKLYEPFSRTVSYLFCTVLGEKLLNDKLFYWHCTANIPTFICVLFHTGVPL